MATLKRRSWSGSTAESGPRYPLVGTDVVLFVVGLVAGAERPELVEVCGEREVQTAPVLLKKMKGLRLWLLLQLRGMGERWFRLRW